MTEPDKLPDTEPDNIDESTNDTPENTAPEAPSAADIEADARAEGWRPESEWRGDPDKWVDADQFLKRGKQFHQDLKRKNTRLEDEIDSLRSENRKILAATARVAKMQEKVIKASVDAELKKLEAQRQAAIEDGDTYTVAQIESDMDTVKKEAEPDPAEQLHPNFDNWLADNSWYDKDKGASATADMIYKNLAETGRFQFDDPDIFKAVDAEMRVRRPDLYSGAGDSDPEPVRKAPRVARGQSTAGGQAGRGSRGPSFSSLSRENQVQYEQFAQEFKAEGMTFMSKEEWAKRLSEDE